VRIGTAEDPETMADEPVEGGVTAEGTRVLERGHRMKARPGRYHSMELRGGLEIGVCVVNSTVPFRP